MVDDADSEPDECEFVSAGDGRVDVCADGESVLLKEGENPPPTFAGKVWEHFPHFPHFPRCGAMVSLG